MLCGSGACFAYLAGCAVAMDIAPTLIIAALSIPIEKSAKYQSKNPPPLVMKVYSFSR